MKSEKATSAGNCFVCGTKFYVGDIIVVSQTKIGQQAAHFTCYPMRNLEPGEKRK